MRLPKLVEGAPATRYFASLSAPPEDGATRVHVACDSGGPPLRLAPGPGGWAAGACAATLAFSAANFSHPVPVNVWYPEDRLRRPLREDTALRHTLSGARGGAALAVVARDNDHGGIRAEVSLDNAEGTLSPASLADEAAFAQRFEADVATALGIAASRVEVLALRAGSITVEFEIQSDGESSEDMEALREELLQQIEDESSPLHQGFETQGLLVPITQGAVLAPSAAVRLTELPDAHEGKRPVVRDGMVAVQYAISLTTQPRQNCEQYAGCSLCEQQDVSKCSGLFSTFDPSEVVISVDGTTTVGGQSLQHYEVLDPPGGQLTFSSANWHEPQVVTVGVHPDHVDVGGSYLGGLTHAASSDDSFYTDPFVVYEHATHSAAAMDAVAVDADVARVALQPQASTHVGEGSLPGDLAFTLDSRPLADVGLSALPLGGDDELAATPTSSASIPAAQWNETHRVRLRAVSQHEWRAEQYGARVRVDAASTDPHYAGNASTVRFEPSHATTTFRVTEDEFPAVIVAAPPARPTALEVGEAAGAASVAVHLTSMPRDTVEVLVAAENTGQLAVTPARLAFSREAWQAPGRVAVSAPADTVYRGPQQVEDLTLRFNSSDPRFHDDVSGTAGTGRLAVAFPAARRLSTHIADDDEPRLGAALNRDTGAGLEVTEGAAAGEIALRLASRPRAAVTVDVAVLARGGRAPRPADAGGAPLAAPAAQMSPQQLVFAPSAWNETQRVLLRVPRDRVDQGNDTQWWRLALVASSDDPAYDEASGAALPYSRGRWLRAGGRARVRAHNVDQEGVVFHLGDDLSTGGAGRPVLREGGGVAEYGVVLSSQPASDVVVAAAVDDEAELEVAPAALTFTPYNYMHPQMVAVRAEGDDVDRDEGYTSALRHSVASLDADFDGGTAVAAAGLVEPADAAAPVLNVTDDDLAGVRLLVDAGGAARQRIREGAGRAGYGVVLESEPAGEGAEVVVNVSVSAPEEVELWTPERLTFTALNWAVPQRVELSGKLDEIDRGHALTSHVEHAVAAVVDPRFVAADAVQPPEQVGVRSVDAQEAGVDVVLGPAGKPVVHGMGRDDLFHVTLRSRPLGNVTVTATVDAASQDRVRICGGGDGAGCWRDTVQLTFTEEAWQESQRVQTRAVPGPTGGKVTFHDLSFAATSEADPKYALQRRALLRPSAGLEVTLVGKPSLSHVVPTHGPAAGAEQGAATDAPGVVHVYGSDFGETETDVEVQVAGNPCLATTWMSDTHLICHSPPGVGSNRSVVVRVGEQHTTNFVAYSYDRPLVFAVDPLRLVTDGSQWLRVMGINFGSASGWLDWVRVGDKFCRSAQVLSDTELRCLHPEGVAAGHVVAVQVKGQINPEVNRECPTFAYALPVITRVHNCSAEDTATRAVDCDTLGGDVLVVEGRNFGVDDIGVTVGARACEVLPSHDHGVVRCVTPPGVGFDLPVVVDVEGQRSAPGRMSYRPPSLAPGQWFNVSASGKELVHIHGADFGATATDAASLRVRVGGYRCLDHWWEAPSRVACITPPGIGQREAVRVDVAGQATEDDSARLSYVPFVLNVHPYVVETGTVVRVFGSGFVDTGSDLECCFGFTRVNASADTPSSRGRCMHPVPGAFVSAGEVRCVLPSLSYVPRTKLVLELSADGGHNYGDDGKDNVVEYAPAVVLTALDPPNGPTTGKLWVHVTGRFFRNSRLLRCRVGDVVLDNLNFADPDVVWISPHDVLCRIPTAAAAGAGSGGGAASVSVSNDDGQHHSPPLSFLYQAPTATSAVAEYPWTVEFGDNPVVVRGSAFSDVFPARLRCRFGITSTHAVYLGGGEVRCSPPPFDHLREWPSKELGNPWVHVRVSNNMEQWGSGNATLTYAMPCRYGYYCPHNETAAEAFGECARGQDCAGNASWPVEPAFLPCPPGHFCPQDNLFRPTPCPRGTYQPRSLQGTCLPCPDGFYCPHERMVAPKLCPPGFVCDVANALNHTQYNTWPAKSRAAVVDVGLVQPGELCPGGHHCGSGARTVDVERTNLEFCPLSYPRETCTKEPAARAAPRACMDSFYCEPGTEREDLDQRPFNVTDLQQNACFAGFECPVGSVRPQGVRRCEQGYYCPGYVRGFGTVPKVNCERGNYCPIEGMVSPNQCPPGTFNPMERATECRVCRPGNTCPPTDPTTETGLIAEVKCRPGWVCDDFGLPLPLSRCPAGYYCEEGIASSAIEIGVPGTPQPCPAGVYCLQGVVSPERKREGTLTEDLITQTCPLTSRKCTRAEDWVLRKDTTVIQLGASAFPAQCLPGSYCGTNSSTPRGSGSCWPGHFCPAPKALVALPNSDALINAYAGLMGLTNTTLFECQQAQTCDLLPGTKVPIKARLGHFAEAEGNSLDSPCFPGFFAEDRGQPTCDPCTPGFQCPFYQCDGQLCPLACDAGFVCEEEGIARQATPCPPGYYCNAGTNTATPLYDPRVAEPPKVEVPLMLREWNLSEPVAVPRRPGRDDNGTLVQPPFPLLFNLTELPVAESVGLPAEPDWAVEAAVTLADGADVNALRQREPQALPAGGGGACRGNTSDASLVLTGLPEAHPDRPWEPWTDYVVEVDLATTNASAAAGLAWFANETDHYRFVLGGPDQDDGPCVSLARYHRGLLLPLRNATLYGPAMEGLPVGRTVVVSVRANATLESFEVYIDGQLAAHAVDGVLHEGAVGVVARGGPVEFGRWYAFREKLFNTSFSQAPVPCPSATFCLDGTKYGDFSVEVLGRGTEFEQRVFSTEGESDFPQPCTEGYFCLPGTDTPQGRDGEGQCEAGFYCPKASPGPIPARLGRFVPLPGRSSDSACPAGRFAAERGLSECALCPAGSFCFSAANESGTVFPIPCPRGTYKDEQNRESRLCLECPAGRYNPNTGADVLAKCLRTPDGMVCPGTGLTSTPQFLTDEEGDPAGVLNNVCDLCSEGFFCPSGTDQLDDPKRCPEGFFCGEATTALTVFDSTRRCETGHVCEKGTFESNRRLTKCAVNHFCRTQQSAPTPCPPGTSSVLASQDILNCAIDEIWLPTNGRRVVSVNPGYPDNSRMLDPLAYDFNVFRWTNPPMLKPEEATFELPIHGFEMAHVMLNLTRRPETLQLIQDEFLVYGRDFRIAVYEGNLKEKRVRPEAPVEVKETKWTEALAKAGIDLANDLAPRPYLESRSDCEWCLEGSPMAPKNITRRALYAPTDADRLNLKETSRMYFRKWVSAADQDADAKTYVSELHYTPVEHYDASVDRSAELRTDRAVCIDYCSRVRDWLGANADGGNPDWREHGIGYGNGDLYALSSDSAYDGIKRTVLPKSFRRAQGGELSITDEAKSNLREGHLHFTVMARRNSTLFLEVEILNGLFYDRAFQLFGDTLSWTKEAPNRTGTLAENPGRAADNQYSFLALLSQDINAAQTRLPLNLNNFYDHTTRYVTSGETLYLRDDLEVRIGRGEQELLIGFLNPKSYDRNLAGDPSSEPPNKSPGLVGAGEFELTEPDPVGAPPAVQDSIKWESADFWQSKAIIATGYLPYVSNCAGYDSYIPLFKLFENPNCTLPPPKDTRATNIPTLSEANNTDLCHLNLRCRFEEDFDQARSNWFQTISPHGPQFYFTRRPWSLREYDPKYQLRESEWVVQDLRENTAVEIEDEMVGLAHDRVPVLPLNQEVPPNKAYPKRVLFDVGYYQKSPTFKEIATATIAFEEYEVGDPSNPPEYDFVFTFHALSIKDLIDNFSLPILVFISITIMLGLFLLAAISGLWITGRKKSKVLPIPPVDARQYFRMIATPAVQGFSFAMGPIMFTLAILYLVFYSNGDITLDFLSPFSGSRRVFFELGATEKSLFRIQRWGLIFVIMGTYGLMQATRGLVPVPQRELHGLTSPKLWFKTHLRLCYFGYLLVQSSVLVFTRSPTFKENVLMWTVVLKGLQLAVSQILQRTLPDKLLFISFQMSTETIMKTMSLGVATFINFLIQYIGQLAGAIFNRALKTLVIQYVTSLQEEEEEEAAAEAEAEASGERRTTPRKPPARKAFKRFLYLFLPPNMVQQLQEREEEAKKRAQEREERNRILDDEYKRSAIQHQELAMDDLYMSSVLFVSQMLGPVFTTYVFLFAPVLGIETAFGQFDLKFYVLFGMLMLSFQFLFDLLLQNFVEAYYGWNITQYLVSARNRFAHRNHRWVLLEKETKDSHRLRKDLRLLNKMGFSSQFYFVASFATMCVLLFAFGGMIIITNSYNPFLDNFALPLTLYVIAFCRGLQVAIVRIGDALGIWLVKPKGEEGEEGEEGEKAGGEQSKELSDKHELYVELGSDNESLRLFRQQVRAFYDMPDDYTSNDIAIQLHRYMLSKLPTMQGTTLEDMENQPDFVRSLAQEQAKLAGVEGEGEKAPKIADDGNVASAAPEETGYGKDKADAAVAGMLVPPDRAKRALAQKEQKAQVAIKADTESLWPEELRSDIVWNQGELRARQRGGRPRLRGPSHHRRKRRGGEAGPARHRRGASGASDGSGGESGRSRDGSRSRPTSPQEPPDSRRSRGSRSKSRKG